jgi:hypothetical protein
MTTTLPAHYGPDSIRAAVGYEDLLVVRSRVGPSER